MCVSVVDADTLNVEVNYHHEQYQTFCYKQLSCLSLYMFVFFTPLFGCDSLCFISNCVVYLLIVSTVSLNLTMIVKRAPSAGLSNVFNIINTKLMFEF